VNAIMGLVGAVFGGAMMNVMTGTRRLLDSVS
jgi:uncharacterized membrane protein YeaQ/YmgE (transglycosylase-associated protein family)